MDDKERYRILKKHGFLPGRYVILRSYTDTKNRGWLSPREKKPDNLIGKRGIIESVHENVIEAVKVYFEKEGDRNFMIKNHVPEDAIWTRIRIDPSSLPRSWKTELL